MKLKAKAENKAAAAKRKAKAKPIPAGMKVLSPHLVCAGAADAIAFYKKAFGAIEKSRLAGKDGKLMHASIDVCGSSVMLVDEMREWGALSPKALKGTPVTLHLYVDDVDQFVKRAVKAGADPEDARRRHVLGRPLRDRRRPVRPSLVGRHPPARRHRKGDARGDEGHAGSQQMIFAGKSLEAARQGRLSKISSARSPRSPGRRRRRRCRESAPCRRRRA